MQWPPLLGLNSRVDLAQKELTEQHRDRVAAVRELGGYAELQIVPDDAADSDSARKRGAKRSSSGHGYYKWALLDATSEQLTYDALGAVLEAPRLATGCRLPRVSPLPDRAPSAPATSAGPSLSALLASMPGTTPSSASGLSTWKKPTCRGP